MEKSSLTTCLHIYYGDGKGKTTAAMGLALRAIGAGTRPCIVQFLKTENSSERRALELLPENSMHLVSLPASIKFVFQMDEKEKQEAASLCCRLLEEGIQLYQKEKGGLLVLDEVLDAVDTGLLPEKTLLKALLSLGPRRAGCKGNENISGDVVLTGRNPSSSLLELADYITEMKALRHPYNEGLPARLGIEY